MNDKHVSRMRLHQCRTGIHNTFLVLSASGVCLGFTKYSIGNEDDLY